MIFVECQYLDDDYRVKKSLRKNPQAAINNHMRETAVGGGIEPPRGS